MKKSILGITGIALLAIILTLVTVNKPASDVIFKTTEQEYLSRDYYELLSKYYDTNYRYQRFEKDLLTGLEKSSEIMDFAAEEASKTIANIEASESPELGKDNITLTLQSLGYSGIDELNLFFANYALRTELIQTYVYENLETSLDLYINNYSARYANHILIKVEDLDNVSQSELNTMKNIKDRIDAGEDFATLAKEFSVDGSKDRGGALGIMDKNSQMVEPFLSEALKMTPGTVSDWVKTEYGFHLIKIDEFNRDTFLKDPQIINAISQSVSEVDARTFIKLIDESEVVFQDEDFKNEIMTMLTENGGL